jgi:hypothetical protein
VLAVSLPPLLTIGSTIVFVMLCWLLHRRDRFVAQNLARKSPRSRPPDTMMASTSRSSS